jgi:hypothetical protein
MPDNIDRRLDRLEEDEGVPENGGGDLIIDAVVVKTIIDQKTGERREVELTPDSWDEGEWRSNGHGGRIRNRWPRFAAKENDMFQPHSEAEDKAGD